MYPSRGPCPRAALCDTHGCDLGDRVAPRHSVGNAGERCAAARRGGSRRRAGSSDGPGCAGRIPRSGYDKARTRARHRPRAWRTNFEKLAAAGAGAILRAPSLRISTMLSQQPEGSERQLRAFVFMGGLRSCPEWGGQVEFLAGRTPGVRWTGAPVTVPSGSLSCRVRAPLTRQRGSLSCRQVDQ